MELLFVILIAGILILWHKMTGLAGRLALTEREVADLGERLRRTQLALAYLQRSSRSIARTATPSTAEPGPADRATPRPETDRGEAAIERSGPMAPAAHATPATLAAPAARAAAAAYATHAAPATWPVAHDLAPAGPGLVHRLLVRLGMTPPAEGEGFSRAAVEAWLEGRLLAVLGGIALLLGAIFFLSLAFSRGWITEPMRVLIGLGAGAGLLVLGEVAFSNVRGILGHVLVAVGLAIVSLALFAATRLFDIVPVEWGLAAAFLAAVAAAAIAIRHDSELVAGFGLIAVLAAPTVLGANPTLVTLLFVAVTLVGTTGVALFRTWAWLPPLAFLLAAPQLASYVSGDAPIADSLIAIAGFWLVNAVAAGGEETRHTTDRLRTTTVTLLLADAAFTVWAGFTVLSGSQEIWRGTFLAVLAVTHLGLGLFFLVRNGDRHPFGVVVTATGVAALAMAAPIQFGGPPVPLAWAAEAVALAWVAVVRRHPYSAGVAVLLGVLAIGHLIGIEYQARFLESGFARTWPFVGPEGMTYAFLIAALVVAGIAVPIAWVRGALAVVGGLLTFYVLPFELSGPAIVAAWAALAAAAAGTYARVVVLRIRRDFAEGRVAVLALPRSIEASIRVVIAALSLLVRPAFVGVAGLAGLASVGHLVVFDFPVDRLGDRILSTVPYAGPEGVALVAVLLALVAIDMVVGSRAVRLGAIGLGLALVVYSVTFEIRPPYVMAAWAVLLLAALAVERRWGRLDLVPSIADPLARAAAERLPYAAAGLALIFLVVQAIWYAPVDGLIRHVGAVLGPSGTPFLDIRSAALAIVAATALAAGWVWGGTMARLAGGVGAAIAVAWLLPFEVRPGYAVAGWAALVLGGAAVIRLVPGGRLLVGLPATFLAALGAGVAIAVVAPPSRLLVDPSTTVAGWPILTDATVALGAIAIALAAGAYAHRADPLSRGALAAAGIVAVYLLSVGLVDAFQRQAGTRPLEELQKEAQVSLSVLWSVLGGIAFATGLVVHRPPIRLAGLALLGLATVKVFLVDLSALDVAYRVLSLVALGVLLLVSALVYARMTHPHPPTGPKPA
jgi:uncharacterized membrane protein